VPAVIWPATTLIVERAAWARRSAHHADSSPRMAASNLAAGWLADKAGAGALNPAGYTVMLWFFFLLSLTLCPRPRSSGAANRGPKAMGSRRAHGGGPSA